MASMISNEKEQERQFGRRAARITEEEASASEQFIRWRDRNPNKTTSNFENIRMCLQSDKEWNPVQLYILYLCFEESASLAASARKFSTFAHRSEKSAYAKISSMTKQLSMPLRLLYYFRIIFSFTGTICML